MGIDKSSDALRLLEIEHKHIGQVLDVLERQVELMENGKEIDYKLIELAIDYFLDFPETCHHPKENLIFARVMAHKPDKLAVIGDLIGEHKELSQLTHRVKHELNSQSTSSLVENNIVPSLKAFLHAYRHHIEAEEMTFFPYVIQNLSQEEFDVIDFDLFDREDPVYDNETEDRFAQLFDDIVVKRNELLSGNNS